MPYSAEPTTQTFATPAFVARTDAKATPNVLTIAGTDPSGGAGIAADTKAFSALGVFGLSVVTAVVAQNTQGVDAVIQLSGEQVRTQLTNLLADVRVDAVKIGMLGSIDVIEQVADVLASHPAMRGVPIVLDPVMVATSGHRLISEDAVAALVNQLVPVVDMVTPNLPEAAVLAGLPDQVAQDDPDLLASLKQLGPAVLLKGGHAVGHVSRDVLLLGGAEHEFVAQRVNTPNTHGTGCTLSAAIAAFRAQGMSWVEAVSAAKQYLTGALQASDRLSVGGGWGHGPVHHFYRWW